MGGYFYNFFSKDPFIIVMISSGTSLGLFPQLDTHYPKRMISKITNGTKVESRGFDKKAL